MKNQKLLVGLLDSITKKQLFFGVWFLIVGFFTYLMVGYYRKANRRNFKEESFGSRAKAKLAANSVAKVPGSSLEKTKASSTVKKN